MDTDTLQGLRQCRLFNDISDDEIIEMMHTIRYRVVRYHKGDFFAFAYDECYHADIMLSGEMVAYLESSERIIRMNKFQSGDMLAPAFLFEQQHRYPVTVQATANTSVFRIYSTDFEKLLQYDKRLMMNFIHLLSNIVANLSKKVGMLSMNVRDKIITYLKEEQQRQQSTTILLPMSRQELASHFGIQKYSLQRVLNQLQASGAILISGKKIEIINLSLSKG